MNQINAFNPIVQEHNLEKVKLGWKIPNFKIQTSI